MIKSKIISKYSVILIFIVATLFTIIKINTGYHSKIDINKSFQGKIVNYTNNEDYTKLEIKGKQESIIAYVKGSVKLNLGDYIEVSGTYKIPSANTIRNNFNYQKYLYNKKIFYTMTVQNYKIIKENENILYNLKEYIISRCNNYEYGNYIKSFVLGDKTDLDSYDLYQGNGVSHLFALSGMHISFLTYFIMLLLKKVPYKEYFAIVILIIYFSITNMSISLLRAIIFFILLTLNKKYELNLSNILLLILTISILLFINPLNIFDIGFQYSTLISLGLILCQKYYKKNYIYNLLITSFASFIISMPITLYNNYEINLLSIINNLINVPLISFIIYPLSIITLLFKFLEPLFNLSIYFLELINSFFNLISINIIVPKVSICFYFGYYLLDLLFLLTNKNKYLILCVLLVFSFKLKPYFDNNFYVNYLDVGQGDSNIIIYKDDLIMIDSGGNYNYSVSDNIIKYLKSLGLSKINTLIITHGDYDHMGEAINLVEKFKVENIIFNCGGYNDLEKDLIKVLDKKKISYYSCIKELKVDRSKLQFLNTGIYDNENDNSLVAYLNYNNYKFLFMGDAGVMVEEDLIEKYNLQDIDVLKVGHHGSKTSSGKEFIDEVNPKYSIISVGKNNRYGHPNDSVLGNLNNSKIYRTDQDGSIEIKLNKNEYKIRTCSP